MATETLPRNLESENSEALINAQLKRTRSQVKSVEFGSRMLKLVVGVLVFFLLATLLDHWVVSEGLPIWARVILWLTLIGGILWYFVRSLLPLVLYRVNPLYAARTIEETKPSLKNSLINYLTLRPEQDRLPSVIYDAIAKQAARGVNDASVDHAVDHAPLIRWGYLLLGLTFCFALYFVLSPKNPFRTVARVVVPWADLTAPSRVQIVEVTPGSAQLYRGKTVKISAQIEGLDEEETATLHYTTADGQQREQPIKLKLDELRNYTTLLPVPSEKQPGVVAPARELAGLQQDFEYYITAGDARSKTYRVAVAPAPYIGVERIEYKYPAYTKKPPETRQGEVNVEALEGTTVTIHGTANQPLKKAWIELRDNAGKPANFPNMKITDQMTVGSWVLGWKDPNSREVPDFASYALRFRNQQGDDNPEPIAYSVKVNRDEAPTIDILAPSSTEITVPWDQPITFEVRAQDPDFGLIEVQLLGMRGDKIAFSQTIASFAAANAHQGNLQKKVSYTPKSLQLQVGDEIEYHMTATDNKVPNPNIVLTAPRRLRVIEAQKNRKPDNDPLAKKDPLQRNQGDPQDNNGQRDPNQPPQKNDQQPQNDQANPNPMGDPGQPNPDQPNNGQGDPQQANDPNARDNSNPNNQPQNPNAPPQPQNGNNAAQNKPNKEQNPNEKPQNSDDKNQQPSGDAGKNGSQQNKPNQQKPNDPSQGNKPGDQQPAGGQPSNDAKNNQEQNPMNGGAQKQQGDQGNDQPNPQSGDQNGKPEQNQANGQPQQKDSKLKSDGSQDSDAFQRAHEHLKDKDFKKPEQKPNDQLAQNQPPNGGDKNNTENKQPPGKPEQGKPEQGKPEQGKPEAGNKNEPGQPNTGKEPSNDQSGNPQGNKPDNGKQEPGKPEQGKPQNDKQGGNQPGEPSPNKDPTQQNKADNTGKPNGANNDAGKEPSSNDVKQQADNKNTGQQDPNGANKPDSKPSDAAKNGTGQKPDPMKPQQQPGAGDKSGDEKAGKTGAGEKPQPGEQADQGKQAEQNGKKPGDMNPDGNRQSTEKKEPGANAKPSNSQENKPGNATDPENKQNPKNDQNQSGGGNPNGSPEAQDKGKPNENPSNSNTKKNDDQSKEQSPSNKGNDSASQGDEGGDKNGGGKPGGGQQENKQGRGASGSNTPDEKGANASNQEGDGETGSKAGKNNKQQSNDKTGKSGNEAGNGSEKKQGDGKQPGGEAGKNTPDGTSEEPGKQPGEPGGKPSAPSGSLKQGNSKDGPAGNMPGGGGGGQPSSEIPPEFNGTPPASPDDPINDAYTKKATDLVLEQMNNQLRTGNVDPELRKKLGGWSDQQMQDFVNRWEANKRAAEQPGPAGNVAANKFRNLGLRPEQSSNAGDSTADDTQRGNRVNRRSAPPSEYRDIYRAFQKGASGG